jgi:tRNA threonylcarbamoyladenosine modification (KEOPS) complex Cgi121 subunit
MVVSGSLEPEASIIDAAMVQEPMVLLAAAGIVLHNYKKNALRARSLHAELVYTLSGSKHVRKSLT